MVLFDYYSIITPASLFTLFIVLPIVLCFYYLVPTKWRSAVLFLSSALYVFFVQPFAMPLLVACVLASFLCGQAVLRYPKNSLPRNIFYSLGIFVNLFVFIVAGSTYQLGYLPAILGACVTPLLGLWHLNNCWTQTGALECSLWDVGCQTLFFPKLYAGPLELKSTPSSNSIPLNLLNGLGPVARGAFKVNYLGRSCLLLSRSLEIYAIQSSLGAWFMLFSFGLALFLTLSGFCEMAQGIAALFGIQLSRGFRYPFYATNVTEFTKRFHYTLAGLGENYVYERILPEKNSAIWKPVCIVVTGMTVGLWYGFSANFFLWGALWGGFLALESRFSRLKNLPSVLGWLYTILFYFLSLVWIIVPQINQIFPLYRTLFSFQTSANLDALSYAFMNSWFVLLLSVLCATSLFHHLRGAIRQLWGNFGKGLVCFFDVLVLIAAIATMTF